jgi:hypothetical protein
MMIETKQKCKRFLNSVTIPKLVAKIGGNTDFLFLSLDSNDLSLFFLSNQEQKMTKINFYTKFKF